MPWSPGLSGLSLREVFWLRSQTLDGFLLTNRLYMWHLIINISNRKIIGCSPHLLPWSFTLLALPCAHQRAQHPSPTNLDFLHWSCCCLSIPIWSWSCLGLAIVQIQPFISKNIFQLSFFTCTTLHLVGSTQPINLTPKVLTHPGKHCEESILRFFRDFSRFLEIAQAYLTAQCLARQPAKRPCTGFVPSHTFVKSKLLHLDILLGSCDFDWWGW